MTHDKKIALINAVLMAGFMALFMSGCLSLVNFGLTKSWLWGWGRSFILAWPLAFVLSLFSGKHIMNLSRRLARAESAEEQA
ncbi:DUF2798 domain-containing protein [Maridesulfovibrio sp.]|uniref:DUF2798 domain-containing protein n=1 Tax=Maridesulfovibrio sp. TaxID=2795000 RepID=UPI002A188E73|nr:DUF2798 domain-containing protein [Maridesulfovibrio sp.]